MTSPKAGPSPDEPDRVIIRDKRRIDPVTGEVREQPADQPAASASSSASSPAHPHPEAESAELTALQSAVAERTADLQRLQAEYANYRKRAERDRLAAGDLAVGRVLTELLPVLDDVERARQHGDLTGALKSVADHLDSIFGKLGLQSFGEVGDPFDPSIHEAVLHAESDAVTEPTCTTVMRPGYKHNDRLLRAAMVGVTDPAVPSSASEPSGDADQSGDEPTEG